MEDKRHGAIIQISLKVLAEILDFKGATIHRVFMDNELWEPHHLSVVIEHPDLPELEPNKRLSVVTPVMQSYYGEDGSLLKVERIDPPKLDRKK